MKNRKPLSLRVPEPETRPGDQPDFSAMKIPEAGTVRRPDPDAPDHEIRDLAYALIRVLDNDGQAVGAWNEKLNLISRKDAEHLEEHHVLHALTLTKVLRPAAGATFADLGTGGGFPGLVLAAVYPECRFTLVDSVGKKIKAVEAIAAEVGLENVRGRPVRAETLREKFDFVTGRAVTALRYAANPVSPSALA